MSELNNHNAHGAECAVKDYFVERDGVQFAGTHLLIEFWGAENLNDAAAIESALCRAAEAAEATVLTVHTHEFTPYGGVTGVAVLAESHITIHTWPERDFAAIDIFMCGRCDPYASVDPLKADFNPDSVLLTEQRRGILP